MAIIRSWRCSMNSPRRSLTPAGRWCLGAWAGGVLLLVLCLHPAVAQAGSGRSVMVLSISEGGRSQEPLRARVSEFLRHTGAKLVDSARLAASARSCEENTCLNRLAEEHRAQLILGARIERHGARDRIIYMWLYDSSSGRDQSERRVCDVRDLEERLHELAGLLIGPYLQDAAPAPESRVDESALAEPEPTPAIETPAAVSAAPAVESAPPKAAAARHPAASAAVLAPPRLMPRARWRTGLAVGLGVLSAGALATAITLQTSGGQDAGMGCKGQPGNCVYDYTPLFAPMYAAAGALAIGAVLSVTIPSRKEVH